MQFSKMIFRSKTLLNNFQSLPTKNVCAMVKANAYGVGAERVCKTLLGKAKFFGVATLEEALDALEADHDYLTENGVFPEELIKNFIKAKREECRQLASIPHPAEYDKYYNL